MTYFYCGQSAIIVFFITGVNQNILHTVQHVHIVVNFTDISTNDVLEKYINGLC